MSARVDRCDRCGKQAEELVKVPAVEDGEATWAYLCDACREPNPRKRGDDDGFEYADPRDEVL